MSKKAQKVQADSGCKGIQGNTSKAELKCVCLNARSIINKKNELDIMVDENGRLDGGKIGVGGSVLIWKRNIVDKERITTD